jgi:hypothetical protein
MMVASVWSIADRELLCLLVSFSPVFFFLWDSSQFLFFCLEVWTLTANSCAIMII